MSQWVKSIYYAHENLSSNVQNQYKKSHMVTCIIVTLAVHEAETGGSLELAAQL